jgi:CDP-diacylglycerol--glycerol-3-phosphate 3-phosphatidyltransferase
MMLQVVGVALVMLSIRWPQIRIYALAVMWGVVLFGLASAIDYFRKFWRKVDMSIKLRRRHELLTMERQKRRVDRAARKRNSAEKKNIVPESSAPISRRSG